MHMLADKNVYIGHSCPYKLHWTQNLILTAKCDLDLELCCV